MAEVKTGLEGVLGWFSECDALGKVYYNALAGSAGTLNCGVGTNATTGQNRVYAGSALVNSSGVWTAISAGSLTIGSAGAETVCVGIEAGTDGLSKVTGGTAEGVAGAIAARTGTTAGKVPLAYVTVGTSGSVLAGSIVDERTFLTAAPISYVSGVDYSVDENKLDIYNRATFAHYKSGRKTGKLTVKEMYVDHGSLDVWPTSSTWHTVPTIAFELAIDGVNGTVSEALLFQRCGKNSLGFTQPEEKEDTGEISATFGSLSRFV